jgi:hypothetical protein
LVWLLVAVLLMLADGICTADGRPSLTDQVSARVAGEKAHGISSGVYAAVKLFFLAPAAAAVGLDGG